MSIPSTNDELLAEAYKCSHAAAEITANLVRGKVGETNNTAFLLELSRKLTCVVQEMDNRERGNKPKGLAP